MNPQTCVLGEQRRPAMPSAHPPAFGCPKNAPANAFRMFSMIHHFGLVWFCCSVVTECGGNGWKFIGINARCPRVRSGVASSDFFRFFLGSPLNWTGAVWHGMVEVREGGTEWYGMVEVCEGAPVTAGGWVLTDRHDPVPCAANSLHGVTISLIT